MNSKKLLKVGLAITAGLIVLPIILLSVFNVVAPSTTSVFEKAEEIEQAKNPETGLTIETKQTIYKQLVEAETKAREEAEAKYPLNTDDANWLEKYNTYKGERQDFHKAPIYSKYNLTSSDATKIITEGVFEKWPER